MDIEKIVKSTQEQATAAWIGYLNQIRLNELAESIKKEGVNLEKALAEVNKAMTIIKDDIINNGAGRGGSKGAHGFIAEVAECGIGNAERTIEGENSIYEWINDNGPSDLKRGMQEIQQKFVNSGGHFSLDAVKKHLEKYPDYLKNGGKYQIPKDHYEEVEKYLNISEHEANILSSDNGDFSLTKWKYFQEYFSDGDIELSDIEPSKLEYKEVQRDTYEKTFSEEKNKLRVKNRERIDAAYEVSKPSWQEAAEATVAAAAIEGTMTLSIGIIKKLKSEKKLSEFTYADWQELAGNSGKGFVKGGVRGISIYALTNCTATPAAVANALVTTGFGVAQQANKLRNGEIDEKTFIENSEALCVDVSVSALSSLVGQTLIPIPVIGAVIGNAIGTTMYQIAKDSLSAREKELISQHLDSIAQYKESLEEESRKFAEMVQESVKQFIELVDLAFDPDLSVAFKGSIALAKAVGVPADEILDSKEKIDDYFLN